MDINGFLSRFSSVKTEDELTKAIAAFSSAMGFGQFRLAVIIPQSLQRPIAVIFSHCSEDWVELYSRENLLQRDPIIHMAMRQTLPIFWHASIVRTPDLPLGAMEVMERATEFGLRNGVSFPLRGAAGEAGILSFITQEPGTGQLMEASPLLRLAADYIFDAAIRVVSLRSHGKSLTKREVECLFWASEGKTSAEIAAILGITTRTVTYYMQEAIAKTNSVNRDQAIAKAAMGGLLIPNLDLVSVEDYQ